MSRLILGKRDVPVLDAILVSFAQVLPVEYFLKM